MGIKPGSAEFHALQSGDLTFSGQPAGVQGEKTAESYIQDLLGLPEQLKVECILAIGHPAEKKQPLPVDKLQFDKVKYNRWAGPPRGEMILK